MLTNLPNDVLLEILSTTHPKAIILLRSTCQRLRSLSFHRAVWVAQFRSLCEARGIPAAIYDIAKENVAHLETSVLHQHRVLAFLRHPTTQPPPPPCRILSPSPIGQLCFFQNIRYGGPPITDASGRFVCIPRPGLTVGSLHMWDLGAEFSDGAVAKIIDRTGFPPTGDNPLAVCAIFVRREAIDQTTYLYVVVSELPWPSRELVLTEPSYLKLYRVPLSALGTMPPPYNMVMRHTIGWKTYGHPSVVIDDNILVCAYRGFRQDCASRVIVWDLVENTVKDSEPIETPNYPTSLLVRGTSKEVYLLDQGGNYVKLDIPPPSTRDPTDSHLLQYTSVDLLGILADDESAYTQPTWHDVDEHGSTKSFLAVLVTHRFTRRSISLMVFSVQKQSEVRERYVLALEIFFDKSDVGFTFFEDYIILWTRWKPESEYSIIPNFTTLCGDWETITDLSWTEFPHIPTSNTDIPPDLAPRSYFRVGRLLLQQAGIYAPEALDWQTCT